MQRSYVDSQDTNVREKILSLFLGVSSCRVVSIIKLKAREEKNSTYAQALQTVSKHKGRRITKNLYSSTSVPMLSAKTCKRKKSHRGKQGFGKASKAINSACQKVINQCSG